MVQVQEPWLGKDTTTQNHPGYQSYAPMDSWTGRDDGPRVMTYIRKGKRLGVQQTRPFCSRDINCLEVNKYFLLNLYRQPRTDEALDFVLSYPTPPNSIIGGDWNVWHPVFEPGVQGRDRGTDVVNWMTNSGLSYTGVPGQPTQRAGHVLDLVFSDVPFVETAVAEELKSGSDHETLLTVVPGRGTEVRDQYRYRVGEDDIETFVGLVQAGAATLPDVTLVNRTEELDDCVDKLSDVFNSALKGAGKPAYERGHNAGWWTEECAEAHRMYRQAEAGRNIEEHAFTEEHRHFLSVVRKAKREYWRKIIDAAITDKKLYGIVNWHKLGPRFKSPPLKVGDRTIENISDKAAALRAEILERFDDTDDLDYDSLEDWRRTEARLPWKNTITLEEVETHTIGVSSTSPGVDGITVRLLKESWIHVRLYVRDVYQKCLDLAHFPKAWHRAEVSMIPKVGKKDRTSPRSWRPIALLSCLGKGMERLMAKRMAWIALTHGVLSPQHGGALPKRSTMDLVASFVHDAEKALLKGLKVSMVTLDVQGAFDALLKNRLLQRMRRQGWPINVLKLTESFLSDRHVRVRLETATTDFSRVKCGTPQGTPWSPVIYMLYLAELMKQNKELRFGYADDICLYRVSKSLEQNSRLLARDIQYVLHWGDENKVHFAPEKRELLHITRSTKDDSNPPVVAGDRLTIHPVTVPEGSDDIPALRWLGVWFDRRFTFKRHVTIRAAKAMALAQHIRSLANTKYGPPASGLRMAVITCVIPTALYGAEAWYGGRTKPPDNPAQSGKDQVSARLGWHVHEIQRALTLAARAAIPVWKTTPTSVVYRDSGLPTAQATLDQALYRFSYRLRTVDRMHPLAKRTELEGIVRGRGAGGHQRPKTKVQRVTRLLPAVQRPLLIPPRYPPGSRLEPTGGLPKEAAADLFRSWLRCLPREDVVVYTDSSQDRPLVGYGYAIYRGDEIPATGRGKLHPTSIVFDAEVTGAWKGLCHVITQMPELTGNRIWVCLDNTAAIWGLRSNAAPSSQWAYLKFHEAVERYDVRVKWCPGHCDVPGNELADKLAKEGSKLHETDDDCTATAYGIKSIARRHILALRNGWWDEAKARLSRRYKEWKLGYHVRCHEELRILTRPELHHFLAARTGHGDFAWYHRKFQHDDATLECSCGRLKDPTHIVRCPKTISKYRRWPSPPPEPPEGHRALSYLGMMMGRPKVFQGFLRITSFFSTICMR